MSYNSSNYWSSPNRRDDNPFEKYKSQRSAGSNLPGFRARKRSPGRILKALGLLFAFVVLVVVWQGYRGVFYGYGLGSLDDSGEHTAIKDADSINHPLAGKQAAKQAPLAGSRNTQIGVEKASLVMLVRYDIPTSSHFG